MTTPRLPDGFAVQLDRKVSTLDSGGALLGGTPVRLLRLSPTAQRLLANGRVEVCDDTSAQLARTLLDATVAHPRPGGGPSRQDVTVVIPVRDNHSGLCRLVMSLPALRVIVVDDGSERPVDTSGFPDSVCRVDVIRHEYSRGPAAARNSGLAACDSELVAFLDSDVVPERGWLEILLGHFSDPAVALAAPRIVALGDSDAAVGRYEALNSALDLGSSEAPVVPYGSVSYVPSAAILCRRAALTQVGGFDETLHSGEDVDLCWRLVDAGFRLRYEPVAMAGHDHRRALRDWLSRRAFYGSSAAALSVRHPDKTAPLLISRWTLLAAVLPFTGTPAGALGALVCAGMHTRRTAIALADSGATPVQTAMLAVRGLGAGATQLASAACRHYWPGAVIAALVSRRARRAVATAAVADGVRNWMSRRRRASAPMNPLSFIGLKRLDDLAYGAGLWAGVARQRDLRALRPEIK